MLARVLSTTIDLGVIANGDLGALISSLFASYYQLLVMAAPMLVIIITTANVGPQHGLKRIAALAAAILLSTILGAVLRIVFITEWRAANVMWFSSPLTINTRSPHSIGAQWIT